ncbi:methylated-DNA--[protein]-cysteine S-methyltransferase [Rubrobacter indicoceani]|uniref:methylated-DNA--[protein]-cysteine S-methyltransferase n=1 Tax=Rubrobacter indicoceani TaxID=2051957 RepID=UPI0019693B8F|nr:methylated-DNA--[protein]-cysteine S-methyltransferase [Rubrobacter indicoceani]
MSRKKAYLQTVASPAGPFTFAADGAGAVIYARFDEGDYSVSLEDELERRGYTLGRAAGITNPVARQLDEYAGGERRGFDLAISPVGTGWQRSVWSALRRIPFAQTRTYSELAAMVGRPGAARAAGRANATNRIPLFVPCHRVVGASGGLTGFAGGIHLKERLLDHERKDSRETDR